MDWIRDAIADLKERNLFRDPPELEQAEGALSDGRTIVVDGKQYVSYASNNYLALAGDKRLCEAAARAATQYGVGSGASRLIVGTLPIHRELERAIAEFKQTEDAVLFPTGFQAGLGGVTSIVGRGDAVILDKLCHACLIDGARASGARIRVYPHAKTERMAELLERESDARRRLIVTDSLFSMDGDLAPLKDIMSEAEKHDAMVLLDEAHATGTVGPEGRGLVAELGVSSPRLIQMGTLSKALGSLGGYLTGTREMCEYIRNTARSYIYTTAPSPPAIAAAIEALRIVSSDREALGKLKANVKRLSDALPGLDVRSPIVPVLVGESGRAVEVQAALRERGIWAPAVRPPTVPLKQSRLRLSLTSAHTDADIVALASAITDHGLENACLFTG